MPLVQSKCMGRKAIEAARIVIEELQLQDHFTPERFLEEREEALLKLFPSSALMPGESVGWCVENCDRNSNDRPK